MVVLQCGAGWLGITGLLEPPGITAAALRVSLSKSSGTCVVMCGSYRQIRHAERRPGARQRPHHSTLSRLLPGWQQCLPLPPAGWSCLR